jgi:glycosyltransferase involved in cell wall biosynthesis
MSVLPDREDQPLVSIVLPTKDGVRHLQAAIDSCLNQTWSNLELILVDDGSSRPETGAILSSQRDPRVRIVRIDRNVGLPRALNAGFAEARGDLLTWTSDDNLYDPPALETMARALIERGVDFVYARSRVIDEADQVTGALALREPAFLPLSNCVGACFLYTRRVRERVGEFDPEAVLAEDYDYWVRVSKCFRMVLLEAELYAYRRHESALTTVHGNERIQAAVDRVRFRHFSEAEIAGAEGLRAFHRGEFARARLLFWRALLRKPYQPALYRPAAICLLPCFVVRMIVWGKRCYRRS